MGCGASLAVPTRAHQHPRPDRAFSHREEYGKLFDFVNAKKLNIKNRGLKEVSATWGWARAHWR